MIILDCTCHTGSTFRSNFGPTCHSSLIYMLERAFTRCHVFLIEMIHHILQVMQSPLVWEEQWGNAVWRGIPLNEKVNGSKLSLIIGVKKYDVSTHRKDTVKELLLTLQVPFVNEISSFSWRDISICRGLIWQMQFSTPSSNFPHRFISLSSFKYLVENSLSPRISEC